MEYDCLQIRSVIVCAMKLYYIFVPCIDNAVQRSESVGKRLGKLWLHIGNSIIS